MDCLGQYVASRTDRRQSAAEGLLDAARRSFGKLPRSYHYKSFGSYHGGRRYAHGFTLSLQGVSRECRRAACSTRLTDVDLVNAYPRIMAQMARRALPTISLQGLESYVESRESHLAEVQSAYSCSREQAKSLYLRTMYGGSIEKWAADFGLQYDRFKGLGLLSRFVTDCKVAVSIISQARGDLLSTFSERRRPELTASCYALAEVEDKAIQIAERHLDVSALIFDGVLVRGNVEQDAMSAIEADVLSETGYKLLFAIELGRRRLLRAGPWRRHACRPV